MAQRLTPADASLVLDHAIGDQSTHAAAADALLSMLPFPSSPTPRLLRGVLLRRLSSDPVSAAALDYLPLLASLPTSSPTAAAAAHIAVAAFLAADATDFDAEARALFARPGGRARRALDRDPALASVEAVAVAGQFDDAVGNTFSQVLLRRFWGDRAAAEAKVMEFIAAEWAAIWPSRLEMAAERIAGDGAVETWRAADEAARAKYSKLAGEDKTREIMGKLNEPTSHGNPIPSPEVQKVMDALNSSCADLHSTVEDPLPAAKAAADEVLAARMEKAVDLNDEESSSQPSNCGNGDPDPPIDKGKDLRKGTVRSLMDRNPTAQTFRWEDSLDAEGSTSPLHRPRLPSPRRLPVSPLRSPDNRPKRRRARKWSSLEEEALIKGVEQFGNGCWRDILLHNPDVFVGRTQIDLKDKWRNISRYRV